MSQNTDPRKDKKTSHHCHTTSVRVWVGGLDVCVCSGVCVIAVCVSRHAMQCFFLHRRYRPVHCEK